jgi:hypothetical protein
MRFVSPLQGSPRLLSFPAHLFSAFLALLGLPHGGEVAVSRVVVRDEVIMRVPVIRPQVAWPVRWVEKKGPKCIKAGDLAAASLARDGSIDFLLRNRSRMRARLENQCPSLDFYGGFYLVPQDERVCAGRDVIRNRMGQSCQIDRFRLMVPRAPK